MVADLLEGGDGGEDGALLRLGAAVGRGGGHQAVEHGLVEADLLGRHGAVVELVDAVGQLGGDLGLGLGAAEHEDAVERPQGRLALAGELGDERGPGADQTGVGEVEDRPQVAEAVLDRRAGEGDAGAGGMRRSCWAVSLAGFLMAWASSSTSRHHGARREGLDVAHRGAVGGDDQVGPGHLGRELVGRRPGRRRGGRPPAGPGVNRAASAAQLPTTAGGAMTRAGPSPAVGRGGRARSGSCPGPCRGPGSRPGPTSSRKPSHPSGLGLVAAQLAVEALGAG